MKHLKIIMVIIACWVNLVYADIIYDESRKRSVPVDITFPNLTDQCFPDTKCSVAFLSAGYGVPYTKYTFLSRQLNQLGYLVVAIGHELPNDPPLSVSGDLYETRNENWSRGAETLIFLKNLLSKRYKNYDFEKLTLIGHSNGGDISAWLANENKTYIKNIITLDHRRVPLPRNAKIKILSIRASDFTADKNVLPTEQQQRMNGSCIVTIRDAKHNDITDFGPLWLKEKIKTLVKNHLGGQSCFGLKKA